MIFYFTASFWLKDNSFLSMYAIDGDHGCQWDRVGRGVFSHPRLHLNPSSCVEGMKARMGNSHWGRKIHGLFIFFQLIHSILKVILKTN